jgi:hypothetical protein
MKPEWGQFFMTQRGQFRMAFDSDGVDLMFTPGRCK